MSDKIEDSRLRHFIPSTPKSLRLLKSKYEIALSIIGLTSLLKHAGQANGARKLNGKESGKYEEKRVEIVCCSS